MAAPGKVEIFFSEPVTVADGTAFLLDGGKYSVAAGVDVKPETNSVIISTGTLSEGEHTVTVNGNGTVKVVDGVGLKVAKLTLNLMSQMMLKLQNFSLQLLRAKTQLC